MYRNHYNLIAARTAHAATLHSHSALLASASRPSASLFWAGVAAAMLCSAPPLQAAPAKPAATRNSATKSAHNAQKRHAASKSAVRARLVQPQAMRADDATRAQTLIAGLPIVVTALPSRQVLMPQAIVHTSAKMAAQSKKTKANVRLAQEQTNRPAADPAADPANQPVLTVPVTPDKEAQPEPAPTTPDATTPAVETPATEAPATTEVPATGDEATIGDASDAEGRPIADVRVVGSRVIPAESILLQATGTRTGAAYSSRQIDLDRTKIDALGYFASVQAQVTPNLEDPTKVDVAFIVVENRVVSGFRFEGNKSVPAAALEKSLATKRGAVLNRGSINTDIERLQSVYSERGFAALVNESRQLEDGTVLFILQEARISRIDLSGLRKTSPRIIYKQIRTKEGAAFNQEGIRRDLNRIYDTGFFEDVSQKISPDPDKPGSVIVTINLKEKRTGQFTVGATFDSNSQLGGFAGLNESNFRGTGKHINTSFEVGSGRSSYSVGVGDNFVGPRNASYDISLFNTTSFREPRSVQIILGGDPVSANYREQRTGVRGNFTNPLDDRGVSALLFGVRNEQARLYRTDGFNSGNSVPVSLPVNSSGRIFAPSFGFLRDARDLRLDPSRGNRSQVIIEKGLSFLGGTTNFTKLDADFRQYFPLIGAPKLGELPRLVLAGRVVIGRSLGQLPAFEQYFVGGTETVRGYDIDEQFGDNQIFSNLELRFRLNKQFQLVGFTDAGRAFGGQFASIDNKTLFSVGAGVRVRTPIGPIRLDLGRGAGSTGFKTHFAIGNSF